MPPAAASAGVRDLCCGFVLPRPADASAPASARAPTSAAGVRRPEGVALIILNTPIASERIFGALWRAATYRICADGGADRLLAFSRSLTPTGPNGDDDDDRCWLPDLIAGDLDSLTPATRAHYSRLGVEVREDPDQCSTDLGKCLDAVAAQEDEYARRRRLGPGPRPEHTVVIHGGLSGRLDQTVHTLHALLRLTRGAGAPPLPPGYRTHRPRRRPVWAADTEAGSLCCVVAPGRWRVQVPWWDRDGDGDGDGGGAERGPAPVRTCGVLPVGVDRAVVTTQGLEWDLDHAETSVGGLLSTSNHVPPGVEWIGIETDRSVVWTVDLPR